MGGFLVVDDSTAVRFQMMAALKRIDTRAEVHEASGAAEAVEAFRKHQPDMVFLDIMLGKDQFGTTVMDTMLQERRAARIVIMTGLPAHDEKVVRTLSDGARAHLPKPITHDAVRAILERLENEETGLGRIM